ncbi:hypothetical protein CUJ83_09360 [Methanocella sp. CWC-04]|uniref:Phosphoribosyl-ATP pyrophosphohydrolase n=1 Tax=Methanooceanicella nereidis TaxID=2052831 RepID=A0AAP2RCV7_9EURY|nr:nucleoside triphosphate pyrophosphohydrolase [Methanocella sp. CWC-04]MCD1295204.1 hypothetical protein [Methanocella sp. CWC-04]
MNKLVRDRIPEIMRASGKSPHVKRLDGPGLKKALKEKLVEEAIELKDAENIKEELADVLEVLDAIMENYSLDINEIERIKDMKRREKGGFKEGYFLMG